jgi:hypothetical protein
MANQEIACKTEHFQRCGWQLHAQTLADANALIGGFDCPARERWISEHPCGGISYVSVLTHYNEGFLCAPSCVPLSVSHCDSATEVASGAPAKAVTSAVTG